MSADAGRAWLAALPAELAAQRRVIAVLLEFCAATSRVRSYSVGCSLGRGAADALSDIDAAVGVADAADVGTVQAMVVAALRASVLPHLVALLSFHTRTAALVPPPFSPSP